jgi:competence protein ComEC
VSDRAVVAAAVLSAIAALVAPAVPAVAALAFVALAVVTRRPAPLAVAVALLVGARAHESLVGLARPLPSQLAGTAQLVGDPTTGTFGTQVAVRLAGRRWLADVDRADEWVVRGLLTGDRVRLVGRPAPFRHVREDWRRSEHLSGRLRITQLSSGPPAAPWYSAANAVHRLLTRGSTSFGPEKQSLFLGLVLGDDRAQSDLERYRFRATGLGHLLAVSGQNVAFALALARPVLERCGLRSRFLVGAMVLGAFVLVTRAEASVLRAAAMAAVALAASVLGRVAPGGRVLALAVVGLLVVDPMLAHSTGFRLSVCATVGLLVGVRPLARRLPGPRWVTEPLATTLAAQLGTAPLLLGLTGGLPAVATVANLLAVPAAGLVMMLGLSTGVVAGLVVGPVAAVLNWPTAILVGWVDAVARVGSTAPLPLLGIDRLALLAGAGVLVALFARRSRPVAVTMAAVAAAVVLAVVALVPVSLGPGRFRAASGTVVQVGPCGRRLVELSRTRPGTDAVDVLEGLHVLGVVRAEVVVAPTSGLDGAIGSDVATQLGARLRERGPSGGPCTVTP